VLKDYLPEKVSSIFASLISTRIEPLPEASTWAMMLLGFAGLGFLTRRAARATA